MNYSYIDVILVYDGFFCLASSQGSASLASVGFYWEDHRLQWLRAIKVAVVSDQFLCPPYKNDSRHTDLTGSRQDMHANGVSSKTNFSFSTAQLPTVFTTTSKIPLQTSAP